MPWANVNPPIWFDAMIKFHESKGIKLDDLQKDFLCGVCSDCLEINPATEVDYKYLEKDSNFLFVGLDINPADIELVNGTFEHLRNDNKVNLKGAYLHLLHGAGGDNENG